MGDVIVALKLQLFNFLIYCREESTHQDKEDCNDCANGNSDVEWRVVVVKRLNVKQWIVLHI